MDCDYLIVGAGFFGSVLAERIANDLGAHVVVVEKRNHIGGNCYSKVDRATGIEYHPFGTHIFHTSSLEVWEYIRSFMELNYYHHQVLTTHKGRAYQMPINLETINTFFSQNFRPNQAKAFIQQQALAEKIKEPKNMEEKGIATIGRPLYEAFIRNYTIKQWGKDPRDLPASIVNRLPVRFNYDESYFHDGRWQGIPLEGYTSVFERLLNSRKIEVKLSCDFLKHRKEFHVRKKIIYSGPLDRFFDYKYGRLEWRSITCTKRLIHEGDFQGTSVMNYADLDTPYTRIHEPRHLHPERQYGQDKTIIFYEYAHDQKNDDGYYPINTVQNQELAAKYKKLALKDKQLIIGGRLGNYAYYDMDKVILEALRCYKEHIKTLV